jgi:3-oxoacyl-[acyl-carrier protein] reductase
MFQNGFDKLRGELKKVKNLQNKVAVVTGASRGIGREIAKHLADEGAFVVVHYNSSENEAREVLGEIKASGGDGFILSADLSEPEHISASIEKLNGELQSKRGTDSIDILVNNAGVATYNSFAETTFDEFDKLFNVNVKSLFFLTQKLLPQIADGGRIINLSSVVARTYFSGILAYSTTKGAVDTFTKHLAVELGTRGITVNAVAPGAIETDMSAWLSSDEGKENAYAMQSLKRVGTASDIARVVEFLAGEKSSWITGQIIETSGGTKL